MEEFSTGSGLSGLADKESSLTKEQLLLGGLTHSAPGVPLQLSRSTNATPGLRYRNLGKSGLRVSNIGLGEYSHMVIEINRLYTSNKLIRIRHLPHLIVIFLRVGILPIVLMPIIRFILIDVFGTICFCKLNLKFY